MTEGRRTSLFKLLLKIHSSDSGLKMKAEFLKILKLFEELEEAGESATLTISAKGGTSTIKLVLESSLSSTASGTAREPCHQLLEDAVGILVQQQGPGEDSGQLITRQP